MSAPLPGRRAALGLVSALVVVSTSLLSPAPSLAGGSRGHDDSGGPTTTTVATATTRPSAARSKAGRSSGANTLQSVSWRGDITTLATFPERLVPPPPFLPPGDISMRIPLW